MLCPHAGQDGPRCTNESQRIDIQLMHYLFWRYILYRTADSHAGAMDQNINATQRLNGLFDAHAYRIIVANVHRKPGQPFRERFTLMTGASCYAKTVLYKQIGNG